MKEKMKYPLIYEEWLKLPSTKKAMKILMKDWNNRNQLEINFVV